MVTLKKFCLGLFVIASMVAASNCKDDDEPMVQEPDPLDIAQELLTAKSWSVQSVTVDGQDKTSSFEGLILQFNGFSFSSNSTSPVWPNEGSWSFSNNDGTMITRGDGVDVLVQTLTESSLVVELVWNKTTFGPGKTKSIAGTHVFSFN